MSEVLDMPGATAQHAQRLLGLWSELALRHVALGAGCGCGIGGVSLRLEDFELDIVGYLEDAALRSGDARLEAHFRALAAAAPREQPLRALLADAQEDHLPGPVAEWMLPRVERTLRSFAQLHGPAAQD